MENQNPILLIAEAIEKALKNWRNPVWWDWETTFSVEKRKYMTRLKDYCIVRFIQGKKYLDFLLNPLIKSNISEYVPNEEMKNLHKVVYSMEDVNLG